MPRLPGVTLSRIESEDFVNWSPKVTILWPAPTNESHKSKIDRPFNTKHYGMRVMPYERVYVGLLSTYHGETIQNIPKDKLWMDKLDVQLTFSRNGLTWQRVGRPAQSTNAVSPRHCVVPARTAR